MDFLCVSVSSGCVLSWLKGHSVKPWPHLWLKLQFHWPAPGQFDQHTAILTKYDSSFPNLPFWKFLTPTPKRLAIGILLFCSCETSSKVKKVWLALQVTLTSCLYIVAEREPRFIKWEILFVYNQCFLGWAGALYCMNDCT